MSIRVRADKTVHVKLHLRKVRSGGVTAVREHGRHNPPIVLLKRGGRVRKFLNREKGAEHMSRLRAFYAPDLDVIYLNEFEPEMTPEQIANTVTHENLHRALVKVGEEPASRALDRLRVDIPRPEFDIPMMNGMYFHPRIDVVVKRVRT